MKLLNGTTYDQIRLQIDENSDNTEFDLIVMKFASSASNKQSIDRLNVRRSRIPTKLTFNEDWEFHRVDTKTKLNVGFQVFEPYKYQGYYNYPVYTGFFDSMNVPISCIDILKVRSGRKMESYVIVYTNQWVLRNINNDSDVINMADIDFKVYVEN